MAPTDRDWKEEMKAIRVHQFGGPEVLTLDDVEGQQPGRGEVLIRVKAIGVNPYDTYMRAGAYGVRNPKLPYTPGSDAAGTVELLGPDVTQFGIGDRVYTTGTLSGAYAEYALCRVDQVHVLPKSVSFSEGSGIYVPYATAYRALFQLARSKPGETVLIHGASGGVGIAAIQWARAAGLKIVGTAGSKKGLDLIREQGATYCLDHTSIAYKSEISNLTNGHGVDVILEMLANENLADDLKLIANGGRIVVVGSRGEVQVNPRELMLREATVTGLFLWGISTAQACEIQAAIDAGLKNQILKPKVHAELSLTDAAEAHRSIIELRASGKIVLIP